MIEKNFFRENAYKIGGVIVLILLLIVVFTLNYKQGLIKESLKKENTQLKQENEKIKSEQSFNKDKYTKEVSSLRSQNEEIKKENTKYQRTFKLLQESIKNNLVESLSIFSPEYTKKGDKIAGLTVSDFYSKENVNSSKNYKIDFKGEFVVNGTVVPNMIGGGYTITIEKNLEKLPHTFQEFEGVSFKIKTDDEELKKIFYEKFKSSTKINKVEMEAVFKNYTYNYVPETDVHNSAELVRMISLN